MFDIKTVPPVVITNTVVGDFSVKKNNKQFDLYHKDHKWMQLNTKTNIEIKEFYSAYDLAYGDVLTTGFGFGILALWFASKPGVKSVTVVELHQEVLDIFLTNNKLPDNVEVVIGDAKSYNSDKHYDCIFPDHFNGDDFSIEDLRQLAKNVPDHNLFWFWSLENHYVAKYYDLNAYKLYIMPVSFKEYDFSIHWQEYLSELDIPTIPNIPADKLREYIETYFNRIALLGL